MSGGDDPPAEDPPKGDPPPPAANPPKDDPPKGGDPAPAKPPAPTTDDPVKPDDEWKDKARKHERDAKKARERAEAAEAKLKEQEDANKTEQEKAVEKAREEGRSEAAKAAEVNRRKDQLEVAATRLAATGVPIGEGDKAKTVKFADPEDALVHLERAIAKDEVDSPFDEDGKVKPVALQEALVELLTRKPHLQGTTADAPPAPPPGDPDAGKGGDDKKGVEEMTPEDHFQAQRRYK